MTEQIPQPTGTAPEPAAPDPIRRSTCGAPPRDPAAAGSWPRSSSSSPASVLAVSLMSPDRYRATARIADDPAPGESVDIETADRRLATSAELVTSPAVLEEAARQLPGESLETLERSVSATVDPSVSILDVVATGEDPAASR